MNDLTSFINEKGALMLLATMGAAAVALGLALWTFLKLRRYDRISQAFFQGKDAQSLEKTILKNIEDLKNLDQDIQELYDISNKINKLAQRGLHRVGMVRFNPFKDIGGDQSFSLAVLDGKNSGFTISSLHTREGTRIYVKPIIKGNSEKYTLTNEEKKSIEIASHSKAEGEPEGV